MEEVDKWLKKAERDLSDGEFNFMNDRLEVAAFLFHQAAEKALKALHILKFKRLRKIHDLVELGKSVNAPQEILKACDSLNPHYIETRYVIDAVYTREIVEEAFENSKRVVKWVKNIIQSQEKK